MLPNQTAANALVDLLRQEAVAEGKSLAEDLQAVAAYAAEQMTKLTAAVGEAGYRDALIAVRDDVLLVAAGRAVDAADAFDARLQGIVQGALHMAVAAL